MAGGALRVLRGCTYAFSCKLGLKKIFSLHPGGVQVHPLHHPGYAYGAQKVIINVAKDNADSTRLLAALNTYK